MFGISLDRLAQILPLALGPVGALQGAVMQAVIREAATAALTRGFTQAGFGNNLGQTLNAFANAFNAETSALQAESRSTQQALDSLYRDGGLADSVNRLSDSVSNLVSQMARGGNGIDDDSSGGGGSNSWLVAIAKVLGKMLGQQAQKLVDESKAISGATGDAKQQNSLLTQFQADSQLFGIMSNAVNNFISTVGQGLRTQAQKSA
jgi:hypothetical protein